jgi:hypothetical protein
MTQKKEERIQLYKYTVRIYNFDTIYKEMIIDVTWLLVYCSECHTVCHWRVPKKSHINTKAGLFCCRPQPKGEVEKNKNNVRRGKRTLADVIKWGMVRKAQIFML